MIRVALTANLRKYYPEQRFEIEARNLGELLEKMDQKRPNFSSYVIDESGAIRKHVNFFANGDVVREKLVKNVALQPGTEVHIMQALSGG